MNRVFVISDTHFGHKKAISFPARSQFKSVSAHDDTLVERWNSVVRKRDTVWHLGDVLFGQDYFPILNLLNGTKKLVMGNHDQYPTARYLEHFSKVVSAVVIHNCILTHIPIHPAQFGRFRLNIHGHMHGVKLDDPRYIDVSADVIGFTPVPLEDVLRCAEQRQQGLSSSGVYPVHDVLGI